jgi:putative peptidoglycan lipid II flippase
VMDSQNRAFEFAMLLTIPAAVALALAPGPIVQALFQRGAFTAADVAPTAYALAIFALGLPAFVLIKVLSPAYFAREDTATPMRFAIVSLTVNTLGSIGLFFLFRWQGLMPHLGIAVATTLGGWLNAALLHGTLVKRGALVHDARLKSALRAIIASSAVMGVVVWLLSTYLADMFAAPGILSRVAALAVVVGGGLLVYAAATLATGALEMRQLRTLMRRRGS